ncbi:MAG: indolepyruvate oxidoreductase subunit beta [Deltaproteobacteria bacterium]|nr:indolepyruvate oxidoreductase subunit beta [Deltaproteobacteria bacterium]MBW2085537.1 indolepyruvate oxidoreductase subunit beta [Deltaproteobacteria bacterium]
MENGKLSKDPYNLIITGVGGQGNVLASRILGNMMVRQGCHVTIGETFGATQRGGSVMSNLRISEISAWSPQIPKGQADMIVALEPTEAIRLLGKYGHPEIKVLTNTRAIHSVGVIAGELKYPSLNEIKEPLQELTGEVWLVDATEEAMKLGNPILSNTIMLGALAGTGVIPMQRDHFKEVMSETMGQDRLEINLKAYDLGAELIKH